MSKKLAVFLLSYKRPHFVKEALDSILAQTYPDFDIIISENTPDDSVVSELQPYFSNPKIHLRKRNPSLPSLEHFNTILSECHEYEYVMLFHDDDLLMPQALEKMAALLDTHEPVVACASNALIFTEKSDSHKPIMNPSWTDEIVVTRQADLVTRYTTRLNGHSPFPSYLYKTKFLTGLTLDSRDGGKYSDGSFLVKLIQRGPFIWRAEPLIQYRMHPNNDTADLNIPEIYSLCQFFWRTCPDQFPQIIFYFLKQILKKYVLAPFKKLSFSK